ncbi:MAG: hypothetical protein HUJ69_00150 [Lachnospiraceae bacterium]|nr:hypothetical protein [Lachnospiraceae bacterium]
MSFFFDWYKRHEGSPVVASIGYWVWDLLSYLQRDPSMLITDSEDGFPVRVAFICDQMTYDTFSPLCQAAYITPYNWKQTMDEFKPQLFFCESAWSGISCFPDCWRGRIYRKRNVVFEQRRHLLKILSYCRENNIPTVFWNKEDSPNNRDSRFDFKDTALKFDYVFTTAQECVPSYLEKGAPNVDVMEFAFSPRLYNPLHSKSMEEKAFFAGSWYSYRAWRCKDTMELLRQMKERDIPCTIYDRNSGTNNPENRYPQDLQVIIKPGVKYTELPEVSKDYLYALNINSVKDSKTMFARRVYEMMAQNHVIISNASVGLREQFPGRIGFGGEEWDAQVLKRGRRENLRTVFVRHTMKRRFSQLLDKVGLKQADNSNVWILCPDQAKADKLTNLPDYCNVMVCPRESAAARLQSEDCSFSNRDKFVLVQDEDLVNICDWEFAMSQFEFLPQACGVRCGDATLKEDSYCILEDAINTDCIFPASMLADVIQFSTCVKYVF